MYNYKICHKDFVLKHRLLTENGAQKASRICHLSAAGRAKIYILFKENRIQFLKTQFPPKPKI